MKSTKSHVRNTLSEDISFIPAQVVQDVCHSVKVVENVEVEWVTWSACADEQADLSLLCILFMQ